MPTRIPWDRYEVALLISAYERVANGSEIGIEAERLSGILRALAIRRNLVIDETFRNTNGMKMQLGNVQYLFTSGRKGLSGASTLIRQMVELYQSKPSEFQTILKEAIRMTDQSRSVEDAFFAYAKGKTSISPALLDDYLKKASEYCHLRQSLLGLTDVLAVRDVQQKVANGKLLRFRYGKDAQRIREATQLYYYFIKTYKPENAAKENKPTPELETTDKSVPQVTTPATEQDVTVQQDSIPEDAFASGDIGDISVLHSPQPAYIVDQTPIVSVEEQEETIGDRDTQEDKPRSIDAQGVPAPVDDTSTSFDVFKQYLVRERGFAERTAGNYWTSLRMIEAYIQRHNLRFSLLGADEAAAQSIRDQLMARPDFVQVNIQRHRQFSAALAHYISFLHQRESIVTAGVHKQQGQRTIIETVFDVLRQAGKPLTISEIYQAIVKDDLYPFGAQDPQSVVYSKVSTSCKQTAQRIKEGKEVLIQSVIDGKKCFQVMTATDAAIHLGHEHPASDDVANDPNASHGEESESIDFPEQELSIAPPQLVEQILRTATTCFPNGIRPGSIIDINKLKRAYRTSYSEEIPGEIDITALLSASGLKSGEKVYFLTDAQKQNLSDLVNGIIAQGHRVLYYSELLSRHGELFESCHIYESPLMQTVFRSILPGTICKAEWLLADRDANEIDEITRAYGDDVVLNYQQVKKRCPYLTMDVIKWALSRSDRFVWSSPETFAQADLIQLDPSEVSVIVNDILPRIQTEGYYSLAQLPIEESCGMNPLVSASAVRDVVFNRYMANRYSRNGLIVKPHGARLSTYQLIEAWLKSQDQVTLTELEDYERELTGHHAVLGISAAGNTMVRIDHDHYVSDTSIHFEADDVDRAIALFAGDRIIPITAITSFTSFPDVPGYTWNLYLVESFLRRFSKRFSIDGGPAQMSYVGGICSKGRHFENYEDRLAHAVVQDGVALTEESIGRYLTERKYILRRSESVRKILDRARILNEQRGETGVRI